MKVCVATPSLTGAVSVDFARSLVDTVKALTLARIETQWRVLSFSNFIHAARNELAKAFLASDYTDLVFIDDDIGWELEGFLRLLSHDVEVVGAICPRRKDPREWNANLLSDGSGKRIEHGGLLECAYLGTGLLRLRRAVVERMPRLFYSRYEGERLIGEDVWFCREFRRCGGRVWADPDITIQHVGLKAWSGNYRRDCHAN